MIINNNELKQMIDVAMLDKNSLETVINVNEKEVVFLLGNDLIYRIQKTQKIDIPVGEYAIGSGNLVKIIKSLPNEMSNINIENQQLIISDSSGDINTILTTGVKINIPKIERTIAEIDVKELIEALKETDSFRSKDTNAPMLMGVCLRYDHCSNELSVAAMDGYRVYVRNIGIKCNEKEDFELIIDDKTVKRLKKIKAKLKLCIKKGILRTGEKYFLTTNNMIFLTPFIDGEYFNYENVFHNAKENYKTSYNNKEIKTFIKYFEKCNKLSEKRPLIESSIENYNHKLSCQAGLANIENNSKSKVENRFTIGYNGKYMLEVLKLFNYSDKVDVQMEDEIHPIIFTDNIKTILLLPIQIKK
ncbi:hypothetical protein HKO22_03005 [Peptoniphilus sp. AGMB00490]|uniref:DNA polymerase III beta sliding clamp central domain-containing protein n=1 Tax=Peptoniphilus faecalis TaxID=2731255 RepID=A0A848RH14_9FIRM|nr:hypothetical protein [Peptoniphilus faecalis]NMW84713.1 hypothetical protein [Peptoniphilus faecalis]